MTVTFGDVVRLSTERSSNPELDGLERFVGLEHIEPGDLRIRRWGDVADGTTFTSVFRPGHVLFGKRRAYQRKVAVADFSGVCSGDIYVLEPKGKDLLPELLPFICQTDAFFEHAVGMSAGSLSPRTNWEGLSGFDFALPPIEEQRSIAKVLMAADRVVEGLEGLTTPAESILSAMSTELICPSRWPERQLDELLDYSSDGPFGSKIKTEHYADRGVRVIRLNNIDTNVFVDDDHAYLAMDYFRSELSSYEVRPGDVVVAGLGDESIPAGRSCVIPDYLGPALNKADCFCLRTKPILAPAYLAFFLNSPRGLAQSAAYSQGTTRMRLNLGNIRRMKVPLAPPEVQQKVVLEMNSVLWAVERVKGRRTSASYQRRLLLNQLLKEGA